MQGDLIAAVLDYEYRFQSQALSGQCGAFLQGMLLTADIPENEAYNRLDFLLKSAQEAKIASHKAALVCQVMTGVAQHQGFSGEFEEIKWEMLISKTLQALPSLASLQARLRDLVLERVGTGLQSALDKAQNTDFGLEIGEVLIQKWELLGEKTRNQLSPSAVRFLAGEIVSNSAEVTAEIATSEERNSLLSVYLYLRLLVLGKSAQFASYSACLQAAKGLFSTPQFDHLSIYLPKVPVTPIIPASEQFRMIYARIRSDVGQGKFAEIEEITRDLKQCAATEEGREAIWRGVVELVKAEDGSKKAVLAWKLLVSGLKGLEMCSEQQWAELSSSHISRPVERPNTGKRWRKVVAVEPREEAKGQSVLSEESKAIPEKTENVAKPSKRKRNHHKEGKAADSVPSQALKQPMEGTSQAPLPSEDNTQALTSLTEASKATLTTAIYAGPFNSDLNPWDLPDKPTPKQPKPRKSEPKQSSGPSA